MYRLSSVYWERDPEKSRYLDISWVVLQWKDYCMSPIVNLAVYRPDNDLDLSPDCCRPDNVNIPMLSPSADRDFIQQCYHTTVQGDAEKQ